MTTYHGRCYCGAVTYEVSTPLKFVAHDHCSICRRIHGAAFVTWCGVPQEQMRVTKGKDKLTAYHSTPTATREFCAICGSHLFFRADRWPGEIHFTRASVIDDMSERPKAHVFASDCVAWLDGISALPRFGGKSGTEPLS
jgi:hypothetical protein